MKKKISILLACVMMIVSVFTVSPMQADAAVSNKALKSIYKKYVQQQLKKGTYGSVTEKVDCFLYDFNKDGVNELCVAEYGGARALYYIYT